MKKVILTESDKKQILTEREQAIIDNFNKTFNSIKRIDENMLDELSPELKHRAFQQASGDSEKYGNEMGGEHDELKSNRRMHQADAFQKTNPVLNKEANGIADEVLQQRGTGEVVKDFQHGEPTAYLVFKEVGGGSKYCGYKITKNEISKLPHSNVSPPPIIARRVERLVRKIQQTELPDLGGEEQQGI